MTKESRSDLAEQPGPAAAPVRRRNRPLTLAVPIMVLAVAVAGFWLARTVFDSRLAPAEMAKAKGALSGRNVLLISIDTLRADHLGCYGYQQIRTPVIDRLAADGVRFACAISPVPLTLPSHTTMLTGLNPPRHGVRDNGEFMLAAEFTTLAEVLSANGYQTGAAVSAFVLDGRFGLAQGFAFYGDDLTQGDRPARGGFRERRADLTNQVAIPWLRKNAGRRFFLFVHYFDPHWPYTPPSPYSEEYKTRGYDGEIAYVDEQLGHLLAALDETGVRDRTLIIVTSDHGESLGEHGEPTHHFFIYDATQHVPLIMAGPAPFPRGHVVEHQVGVVDIVPTLLDLLGIDPPAGIEGVNALAAGPESRPVYIESLSAKLLHGCAPLVGVRRADAKLIIAPKPELYDLKADPHELDNVYGQREALTRELRSALNGLVGGNLAAALSVRQNLVITDEAAEKLRSLGYLVGSDRAGATSTAPVKTQPATSPADPKDMIVHLNRSQRGCQLIARGRFEQGFRVLERHATLCPDDLYSLYRLAEGYRMAGRLNDALATYERILARAPDDINAIGGAGSILLPLNRVSEAEKHFRTVLRYRPDSSIGLLGLGGVELKRGRHQEALALFRRVAEASKGSKAATAYANMGLVYHNLGRFDEARKALERALAIEPGHGQATKLLARIDQARGGEAIEQDIERLRKSVGRTPDPDARLMLGQLLRKADRLDEAADVLGEALAQRPDHVETCYQLGCVLAGQNKAQDAETALRRCIQLDPNHADAHAQLGMLVAQQGRFDEAVKWLSQAIALAPNAARNHYNLGLVLERIGRLDQAIASFRKALEIDPQLTQAGAALDRLSTKGGR